MATDPNTAGSYNQNAEVYHQHVTNPDDSTFHAYYEKPAIRAEIPNLDGLDVISIGCGSGVDARWIADNGAKSVVGIDISSGLIDIAQRENPDIEFHVMDMEQLDFPDEKFDLAYSSLAIHYVDNWTSSLREARRVLRSGGKYIFSCGHPLDTAIEFQYQDKYKWAVLGRRINQEDRQRTVYGNYLHADTDGVAPIRGTVGTVDVTVYHRTFSRMIKEVVASGFQIEQVVEPQPTDGMKTVDPQIHEQLTKMPSFMIWVLRK